MEFVLMLHSIVRWLIVIVTVVALVRFALVLFANQTEQRYDKILLSAFSGLVDLQVLLGLIYLIWSGTSGVGFPRHRIEHAVIMIIAAVLAHLPRRWRDAPLKTRARNNILIIAAVLVLVYIGVARLPLGWSR